MWRRDRTSVDHVTSPDSYLASTSVETRPGTFFKISRPKLTNSLSMALVTCSSSLLKLNIVYQSCKKLHSRAYLCTKVPFLATFQQGSSKRSEFCSWSEERTAILLPAVSHAVFYGLVHEVLVSGHFSCSQNERRIGRGILRLVLVNSCRGENMAN